MRAMYGSGSGEKYRLGKSEFSKVRGNRAVKFYHGRRE